MRFIPLFFLVFTGNLPAQQDTLLENLVLFDPEQIPDPQSLEDQFSLFSGGLLNLNQAEEADLFALGILSPVQIQQFLYYRAQAGPLLSLYELQVVPGFDPATIVRLLPLVNLRPDTKNSLAQAWEQFLSAKKQVNLRWRYAPPSDTNHIGSAHHWFARFRWYAGNTLSWGISVEKDPGERGPDSYAGHFFLRKPLPWLESVALGDYLVRFGQGLVVNQGFTLGKGASPLLVKRQGYALQAVSSGTEGIFSRGAGMVIQPVPGISVCAFYSNRIRDARTDEPTNPASFTSLITGGLHRTESEVASRRQVRQQTWGISGRWRRRNMEWGLNLAQDRFSLPWAPGTDPYRLYAIRGNNHAVASLDHTFYWRQFLFFGEWAKSLPGGVGVLQGLLCSLHPAIDLSIVGRRLSPGFQSIHGRAFTELSSPSNETGLYIGLELRPRKSWRLAAFADHWHHPWVRFQTDQPSRGREWMAASSWTLKRVWEIRWQWNGKTTFVGAEQETRRSMRLECQYQVSRAVEWRQRLQINLPDGVLLSQDLIVKPLGFPLSGTARMALFDAGTRIYAFENDLLGQFSIPSFSGKGMRFYLNLRYKPWRWLTIEGRFAWTSGQGREWAAQVRWEWD